MSKWTRDTPWRQGHLLPDRAIEALDLRAIDSETKTVAIIASHDCDLLQNEEKEPHIEIIVGRLVTELNGNYTNAKTARTLHISFSQPSQLLAEFIATNKKLIPKELLLDFQPNLSDVLSKDSKTTFQRWLASRYRRSAFPDGFERRLSDTRLSDKISKAIKTTGESVSSIFFDVDEGKSISRTEPTDTYILDIYILHSEVPNYEDAEKQANAAKEAILKAFEEKTYIKETDSWEYIQLRDIDVISEEAITYKQYKTLTPWRLEHLSLGATPQQPIPSE